MRVVCGACGLPHEELGGVVVDGASRAVAFGGRIATLTPIEFEVVRAMLASRGRTVTIDSMIEGVYGLAPEADWPEDARDCVWHMVWSARKKLARLGLRVVSVYRVGYRIEES